MPTNEIGKERRETGSRKVFNGLVFVSVTLVSLAYIGVQPTRSSSLFTQTSNSSVRREDGGWAGHVFVCEENE